MRGQIDVGADIREYKQVIVCRLIVEEFYNFENPGIQYDCSSYFPEKEEELIKTIENNINECLKLYEQEKEKIK